MRKATSGSTGDHEIELSRRGHRLSGAPAGKLHSASGAALLALLLALGVGCGGASEDGGTPVADGPGAGAGEAADPDANGGAPAAVDLAAVELPPAAEAVDPAAYAEELDGLWQLRRDELEDPEGWLSLAGLFWLEEGAHTFGSAADSDLTFPAGAPATAGTLIVEATEDDLPRVWLEPAADLDRQGAVLLADGEPVTGRIELAIDATGEATRVELGDGGGEGGEPRYLFYMIERGGEVGARLKDRRSPLIAGFEGIERYPYDPVDYRVAARLVPHDEPRTLLVPNVLGQENEAPTLGDLVFELNGKRHRLAPVGGPGEDLFIVFGDTTNGEATYGGGRFLHAAPPDENGVVLLDFNKSYNPPCVFTPYATCPLPPRGNRMAAAVEAGEKMWGAAH